MFFFESRNEGVGSDVRGVCYYKLCRDYGIVAKSGVEIPFGRLGMYPRRFAEELSSVATATPGRLTEGPVRSDAAELARAFNEVAGRARLPVVSLLYNEDLASEFRKRCNCQAGDPVADYLHQQHYGVIADRGEYGSRIFPNRLGDRSRLRKLPAGREAAIEWPLVRLWCEATNHPGNVIDLLCQQGNADRFIAMSTPFLRTSVSGLSDDDCKVQVTKWALDIEQRRNATRRWLQSDDSLAWLIGHSADELDGLWKVLGKHPVKRSAGVVQLSWGREQAWIGFSSNLRATLDALLYDDLLKAAAAHGWWDVDPRDLQRQFVSESDFLELFPLLSEIKERLKTIGARQSDHPASHAMEVVMLMHSRPFLNLPLLTADGPA